MNEVLDRAEREVTLAIEREETEAEDCYYGVACLNSALKAFRCLMEDQHTGFSMSITMKILNDLIKGNPLTPIEDTDDIWNSIDSNGKSEDVAVYQCNRMYSLFKYVHADGTIRYRDVTRTRKITVNPDGTETYWHNGMVSEMVDELYPIQLPYLPPEKPYKVYCKEYLVDPRNGDFDTVEVLYLVTPEGDKVDLQRFYHEKEEDGPFEEISKEEFDNLIKQPPTCTPFFNFDEISS